MSDVGGVSDDRRAPLVSGVEVPAVHPGRGGSGGARGQWRRDLVFGSAVALLLIVCGLASLSVYRSEVKLTRDAAFHNMDVQVALRTTALASRLEGIRTTAEDAARDFVPGMQALLSGVPGSDLEAMNRLGWLRAFGGLDRVVLVAPDGRPLLPRETSLPAGILDGAEGQEGGAIIGLRRIPGRALQFYVRVPVQAAGPADPLAFLIAGVDAQSFFMPYLGQLGPHSLPMTVVLVQEEGGELVLLGRWGDDAMMAERRVALEDSVLSRLMPGHDGLPEAEGRDHDGQERLAVALPVPGTPWRVAVLVDRSVALSGVWGPALTVGGITLVLMAAVSLVWLYVLQRQRLRTLNVEISQAAELQRAEHLFKDTFEQAAIGLAHLSMDGAGAAGQPAAGGPSRLFCRRDNRHSSGPGHPSCRCRADRSLPGPAVRGTASLLGRCPDNPVRRDRHVGRLNDHSRA